MNTTGSIYDISGRYVAPPQPVLQPRPDGPWSSNAKNDAFAVFAFDWALDPTQPAERFYHIVGGASDGSTVGAETLRELGISVPVAA